MKKDKESERERPYETSTRNVQKVAQSFVLSVSTSQSENGSTGKSSMAKCDVQSTIITPNKNTARKTDVMGARINADTARLRKKQKQPTIPVEWWKEKPQRNT